MASPSTASLLRVVPTDPNHSSPRWRRKNLRHRALQVVLPPPLASGARANAWLAWLVWRPSTPTSSSGGGPVHASPLQRPSTLSATTPPARSTSPRTPSTITEPHRDYSHAACARLPRVGAPPQRSAVTCPALARTTRNSAPFHARHGSHSPQWRPRWDPSAGCAHAGDRAPGRGAPR